MKTIKVNNCLEVPNNFTGIVEYLYGTKEWFKEGKLHRENGPAIEYANGYKEWWIEGIEYSREKFKTLTDTSVFLEIERGRFNLEWIKYLTETGIEEYSIIPGTILHFKRQIIKEKEDGKNESK
jgi:hypothetical protein